VSRVQERLEEIYAIGPTRIGYSREEDAAHELVRGWFAKAGLEVEVDRAGNSFGRRGEGRVWSGSHLDSVPNGGRYDGALGVVAALEVAEREPELPFTVAAFRDEERMYAGSSACVEDGRLPEAYVELHVEQGPVLERAGQPLGIVTAIFGQTRGERVFEGRADHAGTTPMEVRVDALVKAAEFVLDVNAAAGDGTVATVGSVRVEPNASNVVPARVVVSLDARAATTEELDQLVGEIGFRPNYRVEPVAMGGRPLEALREVLPDALELPSGAGHDAGILAAGGVPSAMLFVRSLNGGASHSPEEYSSPEDIELAVDVLAQVLVRIVG
jgi:acetylornithine deacetylase/succinyl-diaminopimelate desuccinylase-like protein